MSKNKIWNLGILFFLCVLVSHIGYGQSKSELEKQRMKIIKELEQTSKSIKETQKNKASKTEILKSLQKQVETRKNLVENLTNQILMNERILKDNDASLKSLNVKHQNLKSSYANMVRVTYLKKRASSKWIYLLSSNNLNNLLMRWIYLKQFDSYTSQKFKEIEDTTIKINSLTTNAQQTKSELENNLQDVKSQISLINSEQQQIDLIIKNLDKEELKLTGILKTKEKEREHLNASIEKIIREELARVKERESKNETVSVKNKIDDSNFAANKGSLPSPVSNGRITEKFGTHPHPTIKNLEVTNNGIDFTLKASENVLCVFDGEVVGVAKNPYYNHMVIVKHGSYYTVYSKLHSVLVNKGDKVVRGQKLGKTDKDENGEIGLHFELWKDKTKLNPELWIAK